MAGSIHAQRLLTLQAESEQRPHKLSYHVSVKGDAAGNVVSELESKLKSAGTAFTYIASINFCPAQPLLQPACGVVIVSWAVVARSAFRRSATMPLFSLHADKDLVIFVDCMPQIALAFIPNNFCTRSGCQTVCAWSLYLAVKHATLANCEACDISSRHNVLLPIAGVTAKVIYSGGADLDILPQHASKGKGLEFLLSEVSLSMTRPMNV